MKHRLLTLCVFVVSLYGCSINPHNERQDVQQAPITIPVVVNPYTDLPTKTELKDGLATVRSEVQASNNAIQTSQTGLNANLNKLGEKVVGVEGKVVGLETVFDTKFNINAKNTAEMNNLFRSEMIANFKAEFRSEIGDVKIQLQSVAKAFENANLEARASAEANLALKSEVSKMQTEVRAGRDAYTNVYQFTKEQLEAQRSENRTQLWTVGVLCLFFTAIIIAILEFSRRRQVDRTNAAIEMARHKREGVLR